MKKTAEEFLREKLESEISSFGDGITEFHTKDVQHLLQCLYDKDEEIRQTKDQCVELTGKINFGAEERLKELLADCMNISNASAEGRLRYIRREYKGIWDKLSAVAEKV